MFLVDFLFAVYDVEYSVCVSGDTNNRKKWKSKTQNPKNQKAPRKIMEHEIRKLVARVHACIQKVSISSGGVGGYTFKALGLDRKHEWDCMTRIRAERREDTAEVMATRHGGLEIKQRKAPENMIAWINSSPVLKPLFIITSSNSSPRCNKNPSRTQRKLL